MALIIEYELDKLYAMICKKSFIEKIFILPDKNTIEYHDDDKITWNRLYDNKDINNIKTIKVPDDIKNVADKYLNNMSLLIESTQTTIKKTNDNFIIKYSSTVKEPENLAQFVQNVKILLYTVCSKKKGDDNMIVIQIHKKIQYPHENDIDNLLIDVNANDVLTNIFQEDTLQFNENLINLSSMILGPTIVNEICVPFLKNTYTNACKIIQDDYIYRMTKYMKKKEITVYKKKDI